MQLSRRIQKISGAAQNRKLICAVAAVIVILLLLPLIWSQTSLSRYANPEALADVMERYTQDPFAFVWVLGLYVVLTPTFFPMTLLTGAVILAFGGFQGFAYSMAGSLASGIVAYYMGQWVGRERFDKFAPNASKALKGVRDNSIIGIVVLRTLPVAPYTLTNMAFGVINIPVMSFIVGTFLGLLPGKAFMALFGTSLLESWRDPDFANIGKAALLFALWIGVILICTRVARRWQEQHAQRGSHA